MRKTIFFVLLFIVATSISAQEDTINQPELDTGVIASKFDYIIEKSYAYKDFQMIRKSTLLKIKNQVVDSINFLQKELSEAHQTLQNNKKTMDGLQKEVNQIQQEVDDLSKMENSMPFFGATLSKSNYSLVMWIIIFILLGGVFSLMTLMKKNNKGAKKALAYAKQVEEEMENLRKKSLLKEQEMMRKLQDERNKNGG